MDPSITRGYLVLADITGYTSFVASNELEHAQGILNNLLTMVVKQMTPALTLAEIEGDAVFVYGPDVQVTRGETILELIESTYVSFRDLQKTMQYNATCQCKACQSISKLDLKFVTHHGEFIIQKIAGSRKPLGSCVNVVHRLLKNRVKDATGWRGYALFSEMSLEQMDVWPAYMHETVESYEHLGEFKTYSVNLDQSYRELTDDRRVVLQPEEADVTYEFEFNAPPAVVWDWLNDPPKRTAWRVGSKWEILDRPVGRTAVGGTNHCRNSNSIEYILDWRPFEYSTVRTVKGIVKALITTELEPVADRTRLQWHMKLEGMLPRWVLRPLCRILGTRILELERGFRKMDQLIADHIVDDRKAA